jgi:hypothetical protein
MRNGFATGWLLTAALAMPAAVFAQGDVAPASAERVLKNETSMPTAYSPLPVSMDNSLPGEQSWVAKTMDQPAAAPASSAAAAMQVQPETCCDPGKSEGIIRRIIAKTREPWPTGELYCPGQITAEYLTNFWVSPIFVQSTRQTFFLPQLLRVGMVLNAPNPERRWLRGSFEALAEFDCIPITYGVGSLVIGGSGILRYNLSWLERRMVSYVQGGFGGVYSDAYLNPISPTSSAFNFMTQVAVGSHFFLTKRLALTGETSFYRISFPNQVQAPNGAAVTHPGFNILGGTIGLTYFFGKDCCRN